jgi:hypothetical protein
VGLLAQQLRNYLPQRGDTHFGHVVVMKKLGLTVVPLDLLSRQSSLYDEPSPFVDIELHQAFVSHFQQEGLASFFIHDIGASHDLAHF